MLRDIQTSAMSLEHPASLGRASPAGREGARRVPVPLRSDRTPLNTAVLWHSPLTPDPVSQQRKDLKLFGKIWTRGRWSHSRV